MLDIPLALQLYVLFLLIVGVVIAIIGIKASIKKTTGRHEYFLNDDNWGEK